MATILIANSDHRFTEILKGVLSAYRHEVEWTRTGEEALRAFEEHRPSVVLLDLTILGLPGLEVLAKMRASDPTVPVMILTGDVKIEVEDRAREMGVTDVLRKRLKMDVIMEAVNRALQRAGRPARIEATPPEPVLVGPEGRPATILLVDDEAEIGALLGEFLRRRGYVVKIAQSGETALEMIRAEPPDLVLLDIYMPGLNGVEVLRRLRREGSNVGVIMVTASQEEPLLKTAMDLGAFDVLTKPVDLGQLELAVLVKLTLQA